MVVSLLKIIFNEVLIIKLKAIKRMSLKLEQMFKTLTSQYLNLKN